MKLIMLGTGNATVTECYNTCFVLDQDGNYFLIDGGGGNQVLHQLKEAGVDVNQIHEMFLSHKHLDHIMGIIWMVRIITQNMNRGGYEGEATIYGHDEVIGLVREFAEKLLQPKEAAQIGKRLHLVTVKDGETRMINDRKVTFFDIGSTKAKQFGLRMELPDGEALTFCGDEPYNECEEAYVKGSKWLLHEAFCLHSQADAFRPYEKHHSTALDAGRLAEQLGVRNLVLYHTEDRTLAQRRAAYTAEAAAEFSGRIFVPDDLDVLEL